MNDRVKSKGEKDRTWLQQPMPGEPLGVTRPVTSYLDTFSLAPPPIPSSSVCLSSFVLRALVASPRLVVRKVHLPASIKGNSVCFSVVVSSPPRSPSLPVAPFFFAPSFPPCGFLRLPVGGEPSVVVPLLRAKPYRYAFNAQLLRPPSLLSALRARNSMEKEKRGRKTNSDSLRTVVASLPGRFCRCNEDPQGQIYDAASCNEQPFALKEHPLSPSYLKLIDKGLVYEIRCSKNTRLHLRTFPKSM